MFPKAERLNACLHHIGAVLTHPLSLVHLNSSSLYSCPSDELQMKADVFWQRPTALNPVLVPVKGIISGRGRTAVKLCCSILKQTASLRPGWQRRSLLPRPLLKIACRIQSTGERAQGALAAAAHPGGVTFPSPSSSAMWGLADSPSMLSSDRCVS